MVAKKLAHPDSWVRVAAAISMRNIATIIAEAQLQSDLMLEDSILTVRIAKADSDHCRRTTESNPVHSTLIELLKNKSLDMLSRRRTAACLLAAHSPFCDTIIKLLWQGLGDCEDPYRMEYLESIHCRYDLMNHSEFRVLIPRILACTGGDPPLQISALRALNAMRAGTEEVITRVLVLLKSKHEDVRRAAVETLGNVGSGNSEVAYALSRLLLDTDNVFAAAVCSALGKQGSAADVFVPNIVDVAHRFESTAVEALEKINTAEARVAIAEIARCSVESSDENLDDD